MHGKPSTMDAQPTATPSGESARRNGAPRPHDADHCSAWEEASPLPDSSHWHTTIRQAALHPEATLLAQSAASGISDTVRNFCTIVGTLRNVGASPGHGPDDIDGGIPSYVLEVAEAMADATGATATTYRFRLSLAGRLIDPRIVRDGARVALSGALRVVRAHDPALASAPGDPGPPVWETHLDVVALQPVDAHVPDGSLVRLEGVIETAPLVRERPIGDRATIPVIQTRLKCRHVLPGSLGQSRARYVQVTVLPLEAVLDDQALNLSALLIPGNQVRIEGRLNPVAFHRRRNDPQVAAALQYALQRIRAQYRGIDADRQMHAAAQRILVGVRIVVDVGYVELLHGRVPSAIEMRRILKAARTGRAAQVLPKDMDAAAVDQALDAEVVAWLARHAAPSATSAPRGEQEHEAR